MAAKGGKREGAGRKKKVFLRNQIKTFEEHGLNPLVEMIKLYRQVSKTNEKIEILKYLIPFAYGRMPEKPQEEKDVNNEIIDIMRKVLS